MPKHLKARSIKSLRAIVDYERGANQDKQGIALIDIIRMISLGLITKKQEIGRSVRQSERDLHFIFTKDTPSSSSSSQGEPRQSSTPEVPIPSPSQGAPNASSSPGIPKPFPQIN
ncbi:hypothetical protein GLOIN_2v1771857 [Rhizophagus irregularis DAOM 181602=DAOM 197198]|nr:hypothetical protein GLOIN_2v1771857 [Rhizophagus irregularis DAOM 181602=DAOM 197198]